MKRIIALFLVVALGFCIFSCDLKEGSQSGESISSGEESQSPSGTSSSAAVSSSSESSSQSEQSGGSSLPQIVLVDQVEATDGARLLDPVTIKAGDSFLGWTAAKVEGEMWLSNSDTYYLGVARVTFRGSATIKGVISIGDEEGPGYNELSFSVADESAGALPYIVGDTRVLWFSFNNEEQVRQLWGDFRGMEAECEIVISDYSIVMAPMMVSNSAKLVEIVSMGEAVPIEPME